MSFYLLLDNIVTSLEKFKLFSNFFQFLPDFYHCPGIELAIAEEGFTTGGGFFRLHELDAWEDGHSVSAILTTLIEIVVIKARLKVCRADACSSRRRHTRMVSDNALICQGLAHSHRPASSEPGSLWLTPSDIRSPPTHAYRR